MMVMIRVRSVIWFATGAVLALVVSLLVLDAVRATAAPGDQDSTFVPMTACRLIDTRPSPDRVGSFSTWGVAETKTVQATGVNGNCTLPADAVGVSMNVTALNATANGFLTFWPGGPRPVAASLNPSPGAPPIPNAVTVSLSAAGSFDAYNERGSVDMVIDVNGYYTKSSLQEIGARLTAVESTASATAGNVAAIDAKVGAVDATVKSIAADTHVVPPGVTITGFDGWDHIAVIDNQDVAFFVQLPVRAPTVLTSANVNFSPGTVASDDDPSCTGTTAVPTAPPGKVCIYIAGSIRADTARGLETAPATSSAFQVRFNTNSATQGDMFFWVAWAYTAP